MTVASLLPQAAQGVADVVRQARPDRLDLPTPCTDFTLGTLVNHFAGTSAALARVGRREPLDPEDPYGSRLDVTGGAWQQQLAGNLLGLAAAWTPPEAWEGSVDMGGSEMPATMIGEMALAEMLLHGWDLARATEQELHVPEEIGRELRRGIEETAELGRSMGAYGPEVPAPVAASEFERALAASGRDPHWRAGE